MIEYAYYYILEFLHFDSVEKNAMKIEGKFPHLLWECCITHILIILSIVDQSFKRASEMVLIEGLWQKENHKNEYAQGLPLTDVPATIEERATVT